MSKPKEAGEYFSDLEEALRVINGVAAVLLRIGEIPVDDSPMFSFLGDQLSDYRRRACDAFDGFHSLMRRHRGFTGDAQ